MTDLFIYFLFLTRPPVIILLLRRCAAVAATRHSNTHDSGLRPFPSVLKFNNNKRV